MASKFLMRHAEKEDLNQYWYSEHTISVLLSEVCSLFSQGFLRIACISTPSLYFSLPDDVKASAKVLDIDTAFQRDPGFILYDFNHPENIPTSFHSYFDVVIIDPPFITREVWEKYSTAVRLLTNPNSRIILSSISENASMLQELLQVHPCKFKPSIPHLVYQYNFFTNYDSGYLSENNSEIPEDY